MTTNPTKIFFELYKILDPTRDDFEVVNANYENVVIFTYSKLPNRIFCFNFCTLFYSEVIKFTISDVVCYKVKQNLHGEIPKEFAVYHWNKNEIMGLYTRQQAKKYKF